MTPTAAQLANLKLEQKRNTQYAILPTQTLMGILLDPIRAKSLDGHMTAFVAACERNGIDYREALKGFRKRFLKAALKSHNGNISHTSLSLGISRGTLQRQMHALEITAEVAK